MGPYNKPAYNPATKSYIELYSPDANLRGQVVRPHGEINWEDAKRIAEKRYYKKVRGRLAVVKTREAHKFLQKHFKLVGPTWIGLRYWCRYRKLQWVTGDIHPLTGFALWGRIWNQEGGGPDGGNTRALGCESNPRNGHWGVHYWSSAQGYYWNANGTKKGFNALFIEYPTGKP